MLAKKAFNGAKIINVDCRDSLRTQNLLQFHDCGICSQSLMHGMLLARVAGIEDFGILIAIVVRHD